MIKPFGDAHTGIEAPELKREFRGMRLGTDRVVKEFRQISKSGMRTLSAVTERAYLHNPLRKFCNSQLSTATSMNEPVISGSCRSRLLQTRRFRGGLAALESALDTIFADRTLRRW